MTKQQILIELLKLRKEQVETYRAQQEYGEWSCGQQDADADQAEHYDKIMRNALMIAESGINIVCIDETQREQAADLIVEVLNDFYDSVKLELERY